MSAVECAAGCGVQLPDKLMWRVTRKPDADEKWLTLRSYLGFGIDYRTDGPEHMLICPECWQAALGFVIELRGTREAKVRQ